MIAIYIFFVVVFEIKTFKKYKSLIFALLIFSVSFVIFKWLFYYLLPFVCGFVFAMVMQPVYRYLKKKFKFKSSFSASIATTIIFLIFISILCTLIITLINQLITVFAEIVQNDLEISSIATTLFNKLKVTLSKFNLNLLPDEENLMESIGNGFNTIQTVYSYTVSTFSFVPSLFMMLVVSVFATYYFTIYFENFKNQIKGYIISSGRVNTLRYLEEGKVRFYLFIKGNLLIYGITFALTIVFFFCLKIKFALLFAVFSVIADVLPILGPSFVYIPLALFYFANGNFYTGFALIIGFAIISIARQIIQPKILASSVKIHPLACIASVYFALLTGSLWILVYLMTVFVIISIYQSIKFE